MSKPGAGEGLAVRWQPSPDCLTISTIDMHTAGEPLRVVVAGLPRMAGRTVLEKRRYFSEHYDHIRTGLILEPRGHSDMYGAVLLASNEADFDVLFLHNSGYSTMCGHAILALAKLIAEAEDVARSDAYRELTFNVPAGQVQARATIVDGRATETSFLNVPSFVYLEGQSLDVPGLGRVRFDVAYGGAFYAIVDAHALEIALHASECGRLIDYGCRIKAAIQSTISVEHPFEPDLSFLYGVVFTGAPHVRGRHSRNVCIFADGELDRSPTGSGLSARAALHYAHGEIALDQPITVESIIGTTMTVSVKAPTSFGHRHAVIPEIGGTAHFTGRHEFYFDPSDPLRAGFMLR